MITKGQKINDRYEIVRSIGEGGMANVYLGYDTILDRNVAIKVLRGDLSNDEKFVRRFQREALSASSLSHPNIVEMYDVGEDNGIYYIVMEYVEGQTLKQLLKRRGSLTLSETIDIMLQLTDGMSHAHDSYIIHRDLKPQNIMIQDDGQIKITDFGIAMALNSTQLTQTNSVMGSVHYLPPEQATGKGSTIKSDVYSMGIIFYELLTGSLPFKGENAVEIALKQMKEPLPSLRDENPSIPMSVENVILKATAKNPKNRYNDSKAMHDDLLTVLDDNRINEERYQYPYPEHEENTKAIKKLEEVKEKEDTVASKIEDKEDKISKRIILILSIVFIGILLILIVVALLIPKLTEVKSIKVPNVTNMTISKAEKTLTDSGFIVDAEIVTVASDTVKKNRVVRTEPSAGRVIKKGTKIVIYKSTGIKTYTIENYVEQDYKESMVTLQNYGLTVNLEKIDPDSNNCKFIGKDVVVEQSLQEGSVVKSGDSITFKILNPVVFPDWNGETQDVVSKWCNQNCVTLNVSYQETTDSSQIGKVISQSRPKDANVKNNDSVSIVIGKKSSTVTETKTCISTTDSTKTKVVSKDEKCPTGYREKTAADEKTDTKTDTKTETKTDTKTDAKTSSTNH
ncbi:MAG: Stk1 family PASTA domain-containing Ser/Thr kinase [Bacilli bacterium]|nr:Stk1 family PASTA domain-containing Ser/Thr kinase [Bacilli bacterium]